MSPKSFVNKRVGKKKNRGILWLLWHHPPNHSLFVESGVSGTKRLLFPSLRARFEITFKLSSFPRFFPSTLFVRRVKPGHLLVCVNLEVKVPVFAHPLISFHLRLSLDPLFIALFYSFFETNNSFFYRRNLRLMKGHRVNTSTFFRFGDLGRENWF